MGTITDTKLQVIETSIADTSHYTATLSDDLGNILSLAEYEQEIDFILLRSISTPPQYMMHGYASKLFISGPLALSARTHKSIKTIGLTESGRKLYEALEGRGIIAIKKDTSYPGVYILTPVNEFPPTPTGTCYEDAWRHLIKQDESYLVHGSIQLSAEGPRVNHAWVELPTGWVWEPQTKDYYTIEDFRVFSPIEEYRYTAEDAAIMVAQAGKHGPWTAEERMKYIER